MSRNFTRVAWTSTIRLQTVDCEVVLQNIEENLVSSTHRVSGKLSISQTSIFRQRYDLRKNILSRRLKHCKTFDSHLQSYTLKFKSIGERYVLPKCVAGMFRDKTWDKPLLVCSIFSVRLINTDRWRGSRTLFIIFTIRSLLNRCYMITCWNCHSMCIGMDCFQLKLETVMSLEVAFTIVSLINVDRRTDRETLFTVCIIKGLSYTY